MFSLSIFNSFISFPLLLLPSISKTFLNSLHNCCAAMESQKTHKCYSKRLYVRLNQVFELAPNRCSNKILTLVSIQRSTTPQVQDISLTGNSFASKLTWELSLIDLQENFRKRGRIEQDIQQTILQHPSMISWSPSSSIRGKQLMWSLLLASTTWSTKPKKEYGILFPCSKANAEDRCVHYKIQIDTTNFWRMTLSSAKLECISKASSIFHHDIMYNIL